MQRKIRIRRWAWQGKLVWSAYCNGGHGGCNGDGKHFDEWAEAIAWVDQHLAENRQGERKCQICGQQRMCFPHVQVIVEHDEHCDTCTCYHLPAEHKHYRMLCTSCWQRTPERVEEDED
jgi:hypothetical protein